MNELVSNSLKYAFPDGRTGEVTIGFQYADGSYTMTVADDGVGFPADVDFRATGSLGMQLATALVGQLNGTIEMARENGTSLSFPSGRHREGCPSCTSLCFLW